MRYQLVRIHSSPPYYRHACVVVEDGKSPDGYRLTDVQAPDDGPFLHRIRAALTAPVRLTKGASSGDETREDGFIANPGDDGYIAHAVRHVPGCFLGKVSR